MKEFKKKTGLEVESKVKEMQGLLETTQTSSLWILLTR